MALFFIALAIALSPTSSQPRAEASAFAVRLVNQIAHNRYEEAWANLHPLHQQVAPLDRYVQCEMMTPVPVAPTAIRALHARRGLAHIPGLEQPVPAIKVALRIVMVDPLTRARLAFTKTVAVAWLNDRWVWFLPAARYAAYLRGECPL